LIISSLSHTFDRRIASLQNDIAQSKRSREDIIVMASIIEEEAKGDGSEKEKKSKLVMKNVSEGIASDEGLVLAAFLRLFNYMYSKSMNNAQS
jgi:hypothetical protein